MASGADTSPIAGTAAWITSDPVQVQQVREPDDDDLTKFDDIDAVAAWARVKGPRNIKHTPLGSLLRLFADESDLDDLLISDFAATTDAVFETRLADWKYSNKPPDEDVAADDFDAEPSDILRNKARSFFTAARIKSGMVWSRVKNQQLCLESHAASIAPPPAAPQPTAITGGQGSIPQYSPVHYGHPSQLVDLGDTIDGRCQRFVPMAPKSQFTEGIAAYKKAQWEEPELSFRPSERQYTAILHMKDEGSAYADYSLLAPRDTRTQKGQRFKGLAIGSDGHLCEMEQKGPPIGSPSSPASIATAAASSWRRWSVRRASTHSSKCSPFSTNATPSAGLCSTSRSTGGCTKKCQNSFVRNPKPTIGKFGVTKRFGRMKFPTLIPIIRSSIFFTSRFTERTPTNGGRISLSGEATRSSSA